MTNKEFDFNTIGKRMPYTTPDGFFGQLKENVWQEVKDSYPENTGSMPSAPRPTARKPLYLHILVQGVIAVAASIVLMLVFRPTLPHPDNASINDVGQAFDLLTTEDQAYLLTVYQEDIFINE